METYLHNDGIEWVKIDKGNNEFVCMPKSLWEKQNNVQLQDADGVVMTPEAAQEFVKGLP